MKKAKRNTNTLAVSVLIMSLIIGAAAPTASADQVSPAAIGWGNLLVPGLGATLRGQPSRGLLEATTEIGTFYGGTFGVREGQFGIDGDVSIPTQGDLTHSGTGMILQQFGLKLHMFDTFYHYQQACLDQQDTDREKNNPQPLYRGSWSDVLEAPFQWRYLSSPYVYPVILGVTGYLIYSYKTSQITPISVQSSAAGSALYGVSQAGIMPLGSAFGEDVFFRGFVEREIRGYTNSLTLAVATESILFALLHDNKLTSGLTGIYFGIVVDRTHGDLGYVIPTHFWLDVVDGLLTYFTERRAEGKYAPLNPPLKVTISF